MWLIALVEAREGSNNVQSSLINQKDKAKFTMKNRLILGLAVLMLLPSFFIYATPSEMAKEVYNDGKWYIKKRKFPGYWHQSEDIGLIIGFYNPYRGWTSIGFQVDPNAFSQMNEEIHLIDHWFWDIWITKLDGGVIEFHLRYHNRWIYGASGETYIEIDRGLILGAPRP